MSLPLIARFSAPGPVMVTAWRARSSPVVSVIVPVTSEAKLMMSASGLALACVSASRRLPAPASLVLVTVNVAAWATGAVEHAYRTGRDRGREANACHRGAGLPAVHPRVCSPLRAIHADVPHRCVAHAHAFS